MRLSIVIPTHETSALAQRAVLAALAHAPQAEIVVVDDGSRDGTEQAVRALDPRLRVLRLDSPRGFAVAANLGLAAAGGEVLLLLNSDAELCGSPEPLFDALRTRPDLGIVGASLHYPDGRAQWSGGAEPGLAWLFALTSGLGPWLGGRRPRVRALSLPRAVDWVSGAAMAIRRTVYAALGPLDESYRFYAQDLDYCRRAAGAGWKIAVLPDFRVAHLHGATIGGETAGGGTQRLDLLWHDLARWYERRHGPRRAKLARAVMRVGGALRWSLAKPESDLRAQLREALRGLRAANPADR